MPLYKTIHYNTKTRILIWNITETYQQLAQDIVLTDISVARISAMKSPLQQLGFLSIRQLLKLAGYSDFDLYYDTSGKPHLKNNRHISITHSFYFSAIIISDQKVGIDIERQRDKILKIANKFSVEIISENVKQNTDAYIRYLTVIWGAKEAIFKIKNEKGISFKDHITVLPFDLEGTTAVAELHFSSVKEIFTIYFEPIQGYTFVYAVQTHPVTHILPV